MLRPILAVLIAASIILFVWQYAAFTERIRPEPIQIVEYNAAGRYDVKVVCTFDCQGNPAFDLSALTIKFRDRLLEDRTDHVAAGEVVLIKDVPDIKKGLNDILISANPMEKTATEPGGAFSLQAAPKQGTDPEISIARSIHVEILHNGFVVAQKDIFSDFPGPFGELVKLKVNKD